MTCPSFASNELFFKSILMAFFTFRSEMQRSVGCGEQMAKMTMVDLDNRLGIKDPMHRKKLFLAMSARQVNITLTLKDLMTSFLF